MTPGEAYLRISEAKRAEAWARRVDRFTGAVFLFGWVVVVWMFVTVLRLP